jgi:hypothetical protein
LTVAPWPSGTVFMSCSPRYRSVLHIARIHYFPITRPWATWVWRWAMSASTCWSFVSWSFRLRMSTPTIISVLLAWFFCISLFVRDVVTVINDCKTSTLWHCCILFVCLHCSVNVWLDSLLWAEGLIEVLRSIHRTLLQCSQVVNK